MLNYLRILIGQIPIFLIGFAVVQLAWKGSGVANWLVKVSLAQAMGMGIDACLYFGWSLAFTPFSPAFFWLEAFLALGATALVIYTCLKRRAFSVKEKLTGSRNWTIFALAGVFAILAAGTTVLYVLTLYTKPSGSFDAYAIWNLRARFILFSPQDWKQAFSPLINWKAHADYPLLWSMNLLRTWILLGRDAVQAGMLQTAVFYVIIPGLMVGGLLKLRGWSQALLGGILLLSIPAFLSFSADQVSDAPLAFFYLATLLLLLLYDKEQSLGLLALAGLAAGLAGWTKNEGLMFEVAVAIYLGMRYLRRPWRPGLGRLAWFGLGLALPLGITLVFKAFLAPPGDIIGTQSVGEMLSKVFDPSRYRTIAIYVLNYFPNMGGWSWPMAVAVPLYALVAGKTKAQPGGQLFWIMGITFLGYVGIYLITPHPLEWHLQYSLGRLMFQLLVPSLFLVLALIRSPQELLSQLKRSAFNEK